MLSGMLLTSLTVALGLTSESAKRGASEEDEEAKAKRNKGLQIGREIQRQRVKNGEVTMPSNKVSVRVYKISTRESWEFESLKKASEALGLPYTTASSILNGKYKQQKYSDYLIERLR